MSNPSDANVPDNNIPGSNIPASNIPDRGPAALRVLIPVAPGSEEIETVTLVDVLRRAGLSVCLASVSETRLITASRRVDLQADACLKDLDPGPWHGIALPGGLPGANHLANCHALSQLLLSHQGILAAICAAPAVVLAPLGLVTGKRVTGYPSFKAVLEAAGGEYLDQAVVVDGQLTTSQGPATAMALGLSLIEQLLGRPAALTVAQGLLHPW